VVLAESLACRFRWANYWGEVRAISAAEQLIFKEPENLSAFLSQFI
jgi:hypothetical protein